MNIHEVAELNTGKELAEIFRHSNPNRFAFPLENLPARFEPPVTTKYIDTENVLNTPDGWADLIMINIFYIEFGLTQIVLPMRAHPIYCKHYVTELIRVTNNLNLATIVIQTKAPSIFFKEYASSYRELNTLLFVSHFHPVENIRLAFIEDYNRIKNQ